MMTLASGAFASAPWPPIAIGVKASTAAIEVIRIGRRRTRAASRMASCAELPCAPPPISKIHQKDAVGNHQTSHHDNSHGRHDA